MAPSHGGSLKLDSAQETFEGTTTYVGSVQPPATGLTQWAYSLVIQGLDPTIPFSVRLRDPRSGREVAFGDTTDGIASVESVLQEQTYELRIEADQPLSFRAICTQTYGYRE
jgi:hypothetical protein